MYRTTIKTQNIYMIYTSFCMNILEEILPSSDQHFSRFLTKFIDGFIVTVNSRGWGQWHILLKLFCSVPCWMTNSSFWKWISKWKKFIVWKLFHSIWKYIIILQLKIFMLRNLTLKRDTPIIAKPVSKSHTLNNIIHLIITGARWSYGQGSM